MTTVLSPFVRILSNHLNRHSRRDEFTLALELSVIFALTLTRASVADADKLG